MSHEQVYSDILLFLPFTNESKELATDPTNCLALYEGNKFIIDDNRKFIYPFSKDVYMVNMIIASEESQKSQEVYNTLNASMIQQDCDDAESLEPIDKTKLPDELETIRKPRDGCKFKPIIPDEIEEMKLNVRKLSFQQRIVFDKIISYCKDVVMARKCPTFHYNAPKVTIHGGGEWVKPS